MKIILATRTSDKTKYKVSCPSSYGKCTSTYTISAYCHWGRRGRDRMAVGFTTTCAKSVTITTYSSNPVHGQVYSIQHYVTCGRSVVFSRYYGFLLQ